MMNDNNIRPGGDAIPQEITLLEMGLETNIASVTDLLWQGA